MSRREGRRSDSKRPHKFDRHPSPKSFKRDEKQERERDKVVSNSNHENGFGNLTDRDQKYFPEAPVAHDPKLEARAVNNDTDNKQNYYKEAPTRPSNPTQHDERSNAWQVGRSSGRMANERGWWKDSREQLIEKETRHRRGQGDEKSRAIPDTNTSLRKDSPSERRHGPPPTTKKRHVFREKKILFDHHKDAKPVVTETVKSNQTDHPLKRNERRGE